MFRLAFAKHAQLVFNNAQLALIQQYAQPVLLDTSFQLINQLAH